MEYYYELLGNIDDLTKTKGMKDTYRWKFWWYQRFSPADPDPNIWGK